MTTEQGAAPAGDLDPRRVADLLAPLGLPWPAPVLLAATASTNDEVEALARAGAPEGACVVADEQTAGRGRRDRTWSSPPGTGLLASVLVRPGEAPPELVAWLPLVAGVAATDALAEACGVRAELKWPNDLVVVAAACGGSDGPRKLGGILSTVLPAGVSGDAAVVIGIGINVALTSAELPVPRATSVLLEGGNADRGALLVALLVALHHRLDQWRSGHDALRADYRARCATIGRRVEVQLPGERVVSGIVTGIDDDGHLLVSDGESTSTVIAGDVIHATI